MLLYGEQCPDMCPPWYFTFMRCMDKDKGKEAASFNGENIKQTT